MTHILIWENLSHITVQVLVLLFARLVGSIIGRWLQRAIQKRWGGFRVRQKVAQAGPPDAEGWIRLELAFESLEAARERIVSFGRGLEVLEPQVLRISVLDLAHQVVELYEH